jgi:hypothetical protein
MKISLNFKVGKKEFKFNNTSKILQFNLLDFNKDLDAAWIHILAIYADILKDDDKWHFFYEGDFSIIRCQAKYQKKLEKYFKDNDIDFQCRGEWKGDHWAVEKYKEYFTNMFHYFSMLAIKMEENEMRFVADRIIHPFFNHCHYMAEQHREAYGEHAWEGYIMAHLAAGRAVHCGRILQENIVKNHQSTIENKDEDTEENKE